MRHGGASVSELNRVYLGKGMLQVMRVFSVILLVMCGVVFTTGPAGLLAMLTPEALDSTFWMWAAAVYMVRSKKNYWVCAIPATTWNPNDSLLSNCSNHWPFICRSNAWVVYEKNKKIMLKFI